MLKKSVIWDGWNCDGIQEILGHWDWSHKNSTLIIKNRTGIVFIPKGETLELDAENNAISKIDASNVELSVVNTANRIYK